jgi:aryl-alcohol dehydrogenase-like predicted oxidoreductase
MRTVEIQFNSPKSLSRASVLGLGCAAMLGRVGRRESLAALGAAYNAGITFYDTARSYGYGDCEGLLGEFFAGKKRETVLLCTKFGISPAHSNRWKQRIKPLARGAVRLVPPLRGLVRRQAADQFLGQQFSVENLRTSLETSLRALRTDFVDILLMHAAPVSVLLQNDLMENLERLVEAGKVRMAGISGEEDVIRSVFSSHPSPLETAQFALNIFNLSLTAETSHAAKSMFLVANHPFGGPEGVARCRAVVARMHESEELPTALREKLNPADKQLLPELVLNCILSETGVSAVIPSMMKPTHLRDNIEAVEHCRFTAQELSVIRHYAGHYIS